MTCPRCDREVADLSARFCPHCGTPLADGPPAREVRRVVSILFADIVGSTSFGEQHDPELVRSLLARYFAGARKAVERHGGTVEKFIGDAVMAVFGLPRAHEDDALRAVRAAFELRSAVDALNARPDAPARVDVRIGINTGEVVAGGDEARETLVTGDAVNIAARLQAAADPGEIFVGARTRELVRDAIDAEALEPLQLKGKAVAVEAYRVRALIGEEGVRRWLEAPIVGRDEELRRLHDRWAHVMSGGIADLVTVVAPAGVGKSRLLRALSADLADVAVISRGRCLSYGDGITFWPVRELAYDLAGIGEADSREGARARLASLVDGEPPGVAQALAAAIGLDDEPASQDAIFSAVRRLLERAAAETGLVAVVEDLHWAEPTLLDLLEYVARSAARPILIVATARGELMSRRPEWGSQSAGGLLHLDPLADVAAEGLLDAQAGASALPTELRRRILEAAEGNALFIEEMVAILRDRGALAPRDHGWRWAAGATTVEVPATVQALLTARLDQLPARERAVVERGSVVGRSFEVRALTAIDAALRDGLGQRLFTLVSMELLRPDRSLLTDGDAYRFRHVLIRDAAYAGLPRSERAVLHERVAEWLERVAGDRIGEFEEIVGYHLEQAVEHRRAVGRTGPETDALARRAAIRLRSAGRKARLRSDEAAVASLLGRATTLATVEDGELGRDLRYLRNAQVAIGAWDAALDTLQRFNRIVDLVDDPELRLRRDLLAIIHGQVADTSAAGVRAIANRVLREAEAAGLPGVQSAALVQLGMAELLDGRPLEEFRLLERAEAVALRDPDPLAVSVVRRYIANRLPRLPMTTTDIETRLRRQLDVASDAEQRVQLMLGMAQMAAAAERFDEARSLLREVRREAEELGLDTLVFESWAGSAAYVEFLAGASDRAEAIHREVWPLLPEDDTWIITGASAALAWAIAIQADRLTDARAAEVDALVAITRDGAGSGLRQDTAVADQAAALVLSWRGDHAAAVPLASTAADAHAAEGSSPDDAAMALLTLATVRRAAGDEAGAREAAQRLAATTATKGLRPVQRMAEAFLSPQLR